MADQVRIIVEPQNPLDLRADELAPLIDGLRAANASWDVRVTALEQRGYGVTYWEVVHIWLPALADEALTALIGAVIAEAVRWARGRFANGSKRPKYVAIHGPDGRVLKSVEVKSAEGDPVDVTEKDQEKPPRQRPPD